MKRELFGMEISQKSKSEMFSATDLVKAGNKWRVLNGKDLFSIKNWLANKSTKEFIAELEETFGKVKINSRGKNSHTWMHPFLFIDLALAISPKLKIEVYGWLYDSLLKSRNTSGSSYNLMCGALYNHAKNKREFPFQIRETASLIKYACDVSGDWQHATEKQLQYRDKIHNNIALLASVLNNNGESVRLGMLRAREDFNYTAGDK